MHATRIALSAVISVAIARQLCPVHSRKGFTCEELELDCTLARFARAAKMHLRNGTCVHAGYTVKGKTFTKEVPVIGKVKATEYTKADADECPVHKIEGPVCGQVVLDCKLARLAEPLTAGLKNGTCAHAGYKVKGKYFTEIIPVIGKVRVTEYTKKLVNSCSLHSIHGLVCGEMDVDCTQAHLLQKLSKGMKKGTCAMVGYTEKGKSYNDKVPVIGKVRITEYMRPTVVV